MIIGAALIAQESLFAARLLDASTNGWRDGFSAGARAGHRGREAVARPPA